MSENSELILWLLTGDVAVQFQTKRDLLDYPKNEMEELQLCISEQGWGKAFLDRRDGETGLWGKGVYSPKWISTHYTLLDLKNIGIHPSCVPFIESSNLLLERLWFNNGRINKYRFQDMCVSAMAIDICCYAGIQSEKINEIIDYLLDRQCSDGGWNCSWEKGAKHSSVHTTISVLEAFRQYENRGYSYRLEEIRDTLSVAWEFLLKKKLFKAVHSGEIIDKKMVMLSFPCRWKYDILRCLDYFQSVDKSYDARMEEALEIIVKKRRKDNRWPVQQKHSGLVHFDMESTGGDSRWNTLRSLRILKKYKPECYREIVSD